MSSEKIEIVNVNMLKIIQGKIPGFQLNSFVALSFLLLFTSGVFIQDWLPLAQQWLVLDGAYSHGFMLLICSVWLLKNQQGLINATVASPSMMGIVVFILSLIGWFFSKVLMIDVITQMALPALLLSMVWAVLGWTLFLRCLIPLALLWFAVPFWDYFGYSLQQLTVFAIQLPLSLLQVTFEIRDTLVELPGIGVFEVAFGCSGLRYLLIAVVLSILIGELWFGSWRKFWREKFSIILAGIFIGLLSNWLRVAIIIYIGHQTDMQSSLIEDHETFGWVLFSLMVAPGIWLFARWSERKEGKLRKEQQDVNLSPEKKVIETIISNASIGVFLGLISLSSMIIYWATYHADDVPIEVDMLPLEFHGWKRLPLVLDNNLGGYMQNPDKQIEASYYKPVVEAGSITGNLKDASGNVLGSTKGNIYRFNLSIARYWYQRTGAELFAYQNKLYDRDQWSIIRPAVGLANHSSEISETLRAVNDQYDMSRYTNRDKWSVLQLRPLYLAAGATRYFLFSSYWVGERLYADPLKARLAQIQTHFQTRKDTAVVRLFLSCTDCDQIFSSPALFDLDAIEARIVSALNMPERP